MALPLVNIAVSRMNDHGSNNGCTDYFAESNTAVETKGGNDGRDRHRSPSPAAAQASIFLLRNQLFQPSFGARVERQGLRELLSGFFQGGDALCIGAAAIQLQANGHVLRCR